MPDISTIAALFGSLSAAKDIAGGFMGVRDKTVVQEKVIELQGAILMAQQSAFGAQTEIAARDARIRELEAELFALRTWEAEKQRYRLTEVAHGSFAYLLKPEIQGEEPLHCLCSSCYQAGKKSILNCFLDSIGQTHFDCPLCKTEFKGDVGWRGFPFKDGVPREMRGSVRADTHFDVWAV
jgi:hypothetical protein